MSFEAGAGWPNGVEVQQALLYAKLEVNADGAHVADDLAGRLFKSKIHAIFTTRAGGAGESRRNAGFPCSRRAGHQHAASALRGNDSGEVAVVQPAKQPAEFRSQYRRVG